MIQVALTVFVAVLVAVMIHRVVVRRSSAFGYSVVGRVMQLNHQPYVGGEVRAFLVTFRERVLVGSTTTDSSGAYRIDYTWSRSNAQSLVVEVGECNGERPLAESRHRHRPGRYVVIDLVVGST